MRGRSKGGRGEKKNPAGNLGMQLGACLLALSHLRCRTYSPLRAGRLVHMAAKSYAKELDVAVAVVQEASEVARGLQAEIVATSAAHSKVDADGTGFGVSPVTVADFSVQVLVLSALHAAFPGDRFIAEEAARELVAAGDAAERCVLAAVGGRRSLDRARALEVLDLGATGTADGWSSAQRTWVLDPIDGTKGFLRGDQYAVALALLDGGRPVLGVLGCPNLGASGTLFYAERGRGAYSRPVPSTHCTAEAAAAAEDDCPIGPAATEAERIRVSVPASPRAGIVRCESMEASHSSHGTAGRVASALGITAAPVRMDGQGKYGMLANGACHVYTRLPRAGYVENIWDHAAGAVIVEEAGGKVTDTAGRPLDFSCGAKLPPEVAGIVASNGECHNSVLEAIASSLATE